MSQAGLRLFYGNDNEMIYKHPKSEPIALNATVTVKFANKVKILNGKNKLIKLRNTMHKAFVVNEKFSLLRTIFWPPYKRKALEEFNKVLNDAFSEIEEQIEKNRRREKLYKMRDYLIFDFGSICFKNKKTGESELIHGDEAKERAAKEGYRYCYTERNAEFWIKD